VVKGKRGVEYTLPISKDYLVVESGSSRQYDLGGLVVYAPMRGEGDVILEDRVYVPQTAIDIIKGRSRSRDDD
jgi:hypothetical protein